MNLTLLRTQTDAQRTFGALMVGDLWLCATLEDPVREVPGQPVASWKIHGKTAIPAGTYRITLEHSPRFGLDTLTINSVPGFVGVRIHAGNTEADTEGCPLVGLQTNDAGIVGGTSRPALVRVKAAVQAAIARGERVTLEVVNP